MNKIIRPAQLADAEAIARVHVDAWRWAYDGLMPPGLLAGLDPAARTKQWQRKLCSDDSVSVFVAENPEGICGFVSCGPCREGAECGEVYAIYLLRQEQGTGLGRALWQEATDTLRSRGHTTVRVWVLDTNRLGRRFYESAGLAPDGETKTSQWAGAPLNEVSYSGPLA